MDNIQQKLLKFDAENYSAAIEFLHINHSAELVSFCIETVMQVPYLELVPFSERGIFLDLVKLIFPNQLNENQWSFLLNTVICSFKSSSFHVSALASEMMLEFCVENQNDMVSCSPSSYYDYVEALLQCISSDDCVSDSIATLSNILCAAPVGITEQTFLLYLERLPAKTLIITICTLTSVFAKNDTLTKLTIKCNTFWLKLLDCLDATDSSIRKKSIFVLHFLVENDNTELLEDNMNAIVEVFETLEETQGHIIRPVLAKIPNIYKNVCQKKLKVRWISIIFNRVMFQESKMISRWGMQLLLDTSPLGFMFEDGINELERLLFTHLCKTYMFYRPNFICKGSAPPILPQLETYFSSLFEQLESTESRHFLINLMHFLSHPKIGTVPLVMISYILSQMILPYKLVTECINIMTSISRTVLPTQPHIVKGAVQGFLLQFIVNNGDVYARDIVQSLQSFLDTLYLEYILESNHVLWKKACSFIDDCVSSNSNSQDYISDKRKCQKKTHVSTVGIGLVIAMGDKHAIMSKIQEDILYPLKHCGTNLYISMTSVTGAASTVNIVFNYYKTNPGDSKLLRELQCHCNLIYENCSLFLSRYSEIISSQMLDHQPKNMKSFAYFIANVMVYCFKGQNKEAGHLSSVLDNAQPNVNDIFVMGQCAAFIHAMKRLAIPYKTISLEQDVSWLLPHLSSNTLTTLEDSWMCLSYIVLSNSITDHVMGSPSVIFNLAIDNVQKMKDPSVIEMVFNLVKYLTSDVINSADIFCNSIRCLWVTLQDFLNTTMYWDLLGAFCKVLFNPCVMENEKCVNTVKHWIEDLQVLANGKENVMDYVSQNLILYKSCEMQNASLYIDHFVDLSLFGVSKTREKQNSEDLAAFIEHLGEGIPVNYIYKLANQGGPLVRLKMIDLLFSIIETYPHLSSLIVDRYLETFYSFQKAALMNSLPNRMRVRIWQAILCLMPIIIKRMNSSDVLDFFIRIMNCLTVDTQPSVRCFIECCACFILSKHPSLVCNLYSDISSFSTSHSNAYLIATFSIILHHMALLNMDICLTEPMLEEALKHVSVWTCANNHNVRSFACGCILELTEIFTKNDWSVPPQYLLQIEYLTRSLDYKKHYTKMRDHTVYFSKFNIHSDLCLFNIFASLPAHFNILENECIERKHIDTLATQMHYPIICGDFHLLPKPKSLEEGDYLIRFKELQESTEIQKKITPWQVLATNLGIDFERNTTVKGELVVFASLIDKGNNLGGLSRTGEIFGIKTMVVNNLEILNNKDFKSLSMTSEKWINFKEVRYDKSIQYFKSMKKDGYVIVGVEQTSNSTSLEMFQFPKKTVLVLGREKDGIPVELLHHLDVCVEIPQLGLIRSLNVHVSASIMIWEYSKQHAFQDNANIETRGS